MLVVRALGVPPRWRPLAGASGLRITIVKALGELDAAGAHDQVRALANAPVPRCRAALPPSRASLTCARRRDVEPPGGGFVTTFNATAALLGARTTSQMGTPVPPRSWAGRS
jgi:hypothetical protein